MRNHERCEGFEEEETSLPTVQSKTDLLMTKIAQLSKLLDSMRPQSASQASQFKALKSGIAQVKDQAAAVQAENVLLYHNFQIACTNLVHAQEIAAYHERRVEDLRNTMYGAFESLDLYRKMVDNLLKRGLEI